jgi:KDO2-lipid IV(A) lauroyltransferase
MDGVSRALRLVPARARYLPADAITLPLGLLWVRRGVPSGDPLVHNVAVALGRPPGNPRVRAVAARAVRNFGRMASDFLVVRTMTAAQVRAWVTTSGEQHLYTALAAGHGVIFALPHVGSWDVAAAYSAAAYGPLTVVVESNWATELVAGSRTKQGVTLAARDRSLRAVLRALARNECVAIMSDLAREGLQMAEVPFFGRAAPFPLGPARLARHTGAAILVVDCVRLPDGRYRLEAQPPLRSDPHLPAAQDAVALTAAIAAGFERIIRAYPDQWYPFGRIWPGGRGT